MPEIAYSGTFFGETLSIAAALATIRKLISHQVPQYLEIKGLYLKGQIELLLEKHNITNISLYGPPQLNRIRFPDKSTQSLFIETMADNGVLIIGSHNTCFAHKKPELSRILSAWDKTLEAIASGATPKGEIKGNSVRESQ